VTATRGGAIASIAVRDQAAAGWTDLGDDYPRLLKELNRRYAERIHVVFGYPRPKLTLEIDGKLLQTYVVFLLDAASQTGFTDVALVPIDPADR
jgi:hypothetical protein